MRYPDRCCPVCFKRNKMYYDKILSNNNLPNQYRTRTFRCGNCDIMIVFEEHIVDDAIHCIKSHILKGKNY